MISKEMKMKDVILENHFLLSVIERFGISLGFKASTVEVVCIENNIDLNVFLSIVNLHTNINYKPFQLFDCNGILEIIDYLKKSHQYYLTEIYPDISEDIKLMYRVNGNSEILMVDRFFNEYITEVDQHFNYENNIVFPYISKLFDGIKINSLPNEKNNYSVSDYKEHHDDIEEKLDDLISLLLQYIPQKGDSKIRRKVLCALFDLKQDLHVHAKIENEILIPLVEKMEIRFKKASK
ncbi:MAG: hemerythrin domain-containing protein [Bacteroidota bacterium]|nr:hemerythrin domain-containing protein [Bacteroidota bacterium]